MEISLDSSNKLEIDLPCVPAIPLLVRYTKGFLEIPDHTCSLWFNSQYFVEAEKYRLIFSLSNGQRVWGITGLIVPSDSGGGGLALFEVKIA